MVPKDQVDLVLDEIATLRAIGFGGLPVVVSVMIEAMGLALVGGAAGGALAYVHCDGASLSTLNFSTFSQVAFDFRVTRGLLTPGLLWALAIGALGGPASRHPGPPGSRSRRRSGRREPSSDSVPGARHALPMAS